MTLIQQERPDKTKYYLDIAKVIATRSTCLRRHYGAVIVKDDQIISTGYNGSARGAVNCVDVHKCMRQGLAHNDGNYGACPAVHAEMNALLAAGRERTLDAILYLSGYDLEEDRFLNTDEVTPCPICARLIQNAGIAKIITG